MKKKERLRELRQRAEHVLHEMDSLPNLPSQDINELVHELHVYHAELEIQIEELNNAYKKLEAIQHRYRDLFDFAPVGYLVTDEYGNILNANIAAGVFLGTKADELVSKSFANFVVHTDGDTYHLHRRTALHTGQTEDCEVKVHGADGTIFFAQLSTQKGETTQPFTSADNDSHRARIPYSSDGNTLIY